MSALERFIESERAVRTGLFAEHALL
jgi:hypothetical protein